MTNFINWLRANPFYNILILAVYYLLVVLPHEWVGLQTVAVFGHLSRDAYNALILTIAVVSLCLYAIPWLLNMRKGTRQKQQIFYLISTILLVAYTFKYLFVINIEVVHFVQYGVFAILCYPLVRNYSLILIWATMMGSIDEGYQYFYLSPDRTDYYDWNDVITNLLGGALGLVFLRSFEIIGQSLDFKDFIRTKTFYTLLVFALLFTIIINTNILDWQPTESSDATFYMVKKVPESWWSVVHPNVTYHVMLSLEGILVTLGLWVFYRKVGR